MMTNQFKLQPTVQKVTVSTSARLHMGFFDLSGSARRLFGGLGVCLDAPSTQLEIAKSENTLIDAKSSEKVIKIVDNLVKSLNIEENFSLKIAQTIPEHAGLGSGTQMALAIGAGLNALFDLGLDVNNIALAAKRGARSGIGIAAFSQGGLLVDSGKRDDALPEIIARESFPAAWRVLLVQDSAGLGVHGAAETNAFAKLKPAQHHLRDLVLRHMLPALQRGDLLAFGAYMQDLQAYNGDYFAPIQGGRYASKNVAEVLAWLQTNGAACVGQSSWGPTGFAILENQQQAESLLNQAQLAFVGRLNISFLCCRGKNTGAEITLG
jgi:beta-ribofuranosylaminobenzene 5'-phosphate synthase